ncbi:MAG: hypothetical protein K0Q72_185 [Armatimonadetes bacterium]|jgi:hypothetical protein|nr:hypothetical protein [Armatimonadota bacterium]
MACRGVFFAITTEVADRLLAAATDTEVLSIVQEEIEERWDQDWLAEMDKSWDAMHRCLTDGTLSFEGLTPLHRCVLGGRQLYGGEDYIISYVTAEEVREIAKSIGSLDEAWLRRQYFRIDPVDYEMPTCAEDCEYTWDYFQEMQALYQRAAAANRAVIFTVDQ